MQVLEIPKEYRVDCAERYNSIKLNQDFNGKSLIDIGCANGYFMARFLNDGGCLALGIDPDTQYSGNGILRSIDDVNRSFDYCFYLDLHYHNGINYFEWIKNHVEILFVASSGVGNNDRLEQDLKDYFGNFEYVSKSNYANRNIYKVRVK